MPPKVSIIVPVYNVSKYLDECILSLINQTYKNIEILIVDDGSIDESLDICEEYAKKDDRIILIRNSHEGVSVARNTGIENASGDWISFVDSDDYAELNMIEELINRSLEYDYDIVIGSYSVINERSLKKEKY